MSLDIGIDFTRNDGPPREVVLTDWELRLVTHCIDLYLDVATRTDDCTAPLARSVMTKLAHAPVAEDVSTKRRRSARRRELGEIARRLGNLPDCLHPNHTVTWAHKQADGSPRVFDGVVFGTCEECGVRVQRPVDGGEWKAIA